MTLFFQKYNLFKRYERCDTLISCHVLKMPNRKGILDYNFLFSDFPINVSSKIISTCVYLIPKSWRGHKLLKKVIMRCFHLANFATQGFLILLFNSKHTYHPMTLSFCALSNLIKASCFFVDKTTLALFCSEMTLKSRSLLPMKIRLSHLILDLSKSWNFLLYDIITIRWLSSIFQLKCFYHCFSSKTTNILQHTVLPVKSH